MNFDDSRDIKYSERIVAFLDFLGWRNAVAASENDELAMNRLVRIFAEYFRPEQRNREMWSKFLAPRGVPQPGEWQLETAQFSDSVIMSVGYSDGSPMGEIPLYLRMMELSTNIHRIVERALRCGFLIRGGIAVGPVYHSGVHAFGPALTAAYDLELKAAIVPRVIVSPELSRRLHENDPEQLETIGFEKDDDGHYFLGFVRDCSSAALVGDLINRWLGSDDRSEALATKYKWLTRYYNRTISSLQCTELNTISLPSAAAGGAT